jgi:hypothetical protein
MFLRTDHHDNFKAARRIAKFFSDKVEVLGGDKLVKKITLDDFSEEDLETSKTGFYTLLPAKDSVGRLISFCDFRRVDFTRSESMERRNGWAGN